MLLRLSEQHYTQCVAFLLFGRPAGLRALRVAGAYHARSRIKWIKARSGVYRIQWISAWVCRQSGARAWFLWFCYWGLRLSNRLLWSWFLRFWFLRLWLLRFWFLGGLWLGLRRRLSRLLRRKGWVEFVWQAKPRFHTLDNALYLKVVDVLL